MLNWVTTLVSCAVRICLIWATARARGRVGIVRFSPVAKRPFIFMNAVGTDRDVRTLLHEAGHAFHGFAVSQLPYHQQKDPPIEFAEVASMAMELLSAPYWSASEGGYYSKEGHGSCPPPASGEHPAVLAFYGRC